MGSYSRTVFAIFGAIFASLVLVGVFTTFGVIADFILLALGALHMIGSTDPASEAQSIFNFSNPTLLIAPCIGLALGLLLALLISSGILKRAADVNWLEKHGRRVMAQITKITPYQGTRRDANGYTTYYTYYIIAADWVDPQTRYVHTFKSDPLYSAKSYQIGDAVQVMIDPENIDGKNYMYVAS